MCEPVMNVYLSLEVPNEALCLVVKQGKLILIRSDEFLNSDPKIGLWEINYSSGTMGDGYRATHYIYNKKNNVSIINLGGVASLISGRPVNPLEYISFKLLKQMTKFSEWILSSPDNVGMHMTRNANNIVVFTDAPEDKCIWVQEIIS